MADGKIDPLLPMIVVGRPLVLNNRTRAQIVSDMVIDIRDMAATRRRLNAAVLDQIEFAQAEALAREGWGEGQERLAAPQRGQIDDKS